MLFAAVRWSLMALSGQSNRTRVCPLLEDIVAKVFLHC
jgi:hypothetical protein